MIGFQKNGYRCYQKSLRIDSKKYLLTCYDIDMDMQRDLKTEKGGVVVGHNKKRRK